MKKWMLLIAFVAGFSWAEGVESLRGSIAIGDQAPANETASTIEGKEANKEIFSQKDVEPSMIPHTIDAYGITLENNMCLMCHEKGISGASAIPESHFTDDRSGEVTEKVDGRRYFCTQCHTSQIDSEPLVKNNRD